MKRTINLINDFMYIFFNQFWILDFISGIVTLE